MGDDVGVTSHPFLATQKTIASFPNGIAGAVLRNGESQQTRFLIQTDEPTADITDFGGYTNTSARSYHGEVRYDRQISGSNLLSVGAATGFRHFGTENLFLLNPPFADPSFTINTLTTARTYEAYVRNVAALTSHVDLTLEMKVDRLDYHMDATGAPQTGSTPTVGLPTAILEYRPDPQDGFRLRARNLFGTIQDFELWRPAMFFSFLLTTCHPWHWAARGKAMNWSMIILIMTHRSPPRCVSAGPTECSGWCGRQ